ncbi:LysR family transcriptional regulator [Xenophilus sp. Marseille-Q4582]|uniref:LysR family transcriptional regulator n=1 Tax=Xenophilus sp. Marseille-Q4582 TaxID=2866600 RepID=UPI001CE3EC72|nr:LysR substrate-binding domain-containing protein [Xenophilus sp. Marseille-Q4582]
MKPSQLQAFAAVAAHQSIRGAARALGVSQPAVTRIVRELEREVDAPLVERSLKGVTLTEYGQAFAPRARQLLEDMRRARDEILQMREGVRGRVTLAVSTAVALTLLPPAFKTFHARLPGVDVRFHEVTMPGMLAQLTDGRLDFVVSHVLPASLPEDFVAEELFPVRLVVGLRRMHPLRRATRLQELHGAEWVLPADDSVGGHAISPVFSASGLPVPARVVQGQSVSVALGLISQTDLVGLFVEPLLPLFKHYGVRRLVLDHALPAIPVCVITRRGRALTPVAQQFVAGVRAEAQARAGAQAQAVG